MTTSMFLALSIFVLFISLMLSLNGAQFLSNTSLLSLSGSSGACIVRLI